jgi:transposase
MSRELRADYTTQFLFPPSLENWVKPEDPARFIRAFVDSLDLEEIAGEEWAKGADDPYGRPHYAFDLLLKVWLYGYVFNIRSSRKLERACRQMMPLVWLAGMYEPDHNTLWRFWKQYRESLKKVFVNSVRVAIEANLVGMVVQAVDGTKIASAGSPKAAWHRENLEKILKAVDERIETLEREIEMAKQSDAEVDERLPKKLQDEAELRATVQQALQTLQTADAEHLHPHDRDARMMKGGTAKRIEFAYNAQAVCDASHGIVVAADVVNEENDQHQLGPMLEQVIDNAGRAADETLADSGYDTGESLAKAEQLGAAVLVVQKIDPEQVGPFHVARFTYDEQTGAVHCPLGQELRRVGVTTHHDKPHELTRYRCDVWKSCPVGRSCSASKARVIEITPHYGAMLRQREKRADQDAKKRLKRRSEIIERLFGQVKGNDGFRRWTFRGCQKVQAQWMMICTAINLRRIMAAFTPGISAPA